VWAGSWYSLDEERQIWNKRYELYETSPTTCAAVFITASPSV
jgi:hypothetical protein